MGDITRYPSDPEARAIIEGVRSRYEAEGYAFIVEPEPSTLPVFMKSYRPDALATRPGHNIAIAIKSPRSPGKQASLQEIRRLFESRSDWQLDVLSAGQPSVAIPLVSPDTILQHKREVASLAANGHRRAAFVMAWSLLEGALQSIKIVENRPRPAGGVLELLAREGYIEPDMERRIHPLVQLRNRIVHGDVLAEPSDDDVALVLAAIDQTILTDAA